MDTSNPSGWVIAGPAPFRRIWHVDQAPELADAPRVNPVGAIAIPSDIDPAALAGLCAAVEAVGLVVTLDSKETDLLADGAGLTFELWREVV